MWIHAFLNVNGRVARLMSHAILLEPLDTGGLWSVARGLARNVSRYKASRPGVICPGATISTVTDVERVSRTSFRRLHSIRCVSRTDRTEPTARARVAKKEFRRDALPPRASQVGEAMLYLGEFPRGEVAALLRVTDRHARPI